MEGDMSTTLSPAAASSMRRTLSPSLAYALVASVVGLALFASITPSPLYGIYRELWGFSPLVLTLVYATYAFGVLTSLILAGRLSDEVGRRPVLLVALGTLMVTSVVFMLADSVVWLFAARGLQGLATGLALGAASAAMLDLHPRTRRAVSRTISTTLPTFCALRFSRSGRQRHSSRSP
jgi:MFS family permease